MKANKPVRLYSLFDMRSMGGKIAHVRVSPLALPLYRASVVWGGHLHCGFSLRVVRSKLSVFTGVSHAA